MVETSSGHGWWQWQQGQGLEDEREKKEEFVDG
jgi:hypothetical protein